MHPIWWDGMGSFLHDAKEHFKEVAWALFLINLFILVFFLLFGKYAGYDLMAWIAMGTSLFVFVIFGSIYAANLLVILGWYIYTRLRRPKTPGFGKAGRDGN
jgi:hypothetical protein